MSFPNAGWGRVAKSELAQLEGFIPLPNLQQSCQDCLSPDLFRLFKQSSEEWARFHDGRLTTSSLASFLGFFEPRAAMQLGVPKGLRSHTKGLAAFSRIKRSASGQVSSLPVWQGGCFAEARTDLPPLLQLLQKAGFEDGPLPESLHLAVGEVSRGRWDTLEELRRALSHADGGAAASSSLLHPRYSARSAMEARLLWGQLHESTALHSVLCALKDKQFEQQESMTAAAAAVTVGGIQVQQQQQAHGKGSSSKTLLVPAATLLKQRGKALSSPRSLTSTAVQAEEKSRAEDGASASAVAPPSAPAAVALAPPSPSSQLLSASSLSPALPAAAPVTTACEKLPASQPAPPSLPPLLLELGLCPLEALPPSSLHKLGLSPSQLQSLPLMGASPDGLIYYPSSGAVEVVEAKSHSPFSVKTLRSSSSGSSVRFTVDDRGPMQYIGPWHMPQVQLEILCAGPACRGCRFVSQSSTQGAKVWFVPRDDAYIAAMLQSVVALKQYFFSPPKRMGRGRGKGKGKEKGKALGRGSGSRQKGRGEGASGKSGEDTGPSPSSAPAPSPELVWSGSLPKDFGFAAPGYAAFLQATVALAQRAQLCAVVPPLINRGAPAASSALTSAPLLASSSASGATAASAEASGARASSPLESSTTTSSTAAGPLSGPSGEAHSLAAEAYRQPFHDSFILQQMKKAEQEDKLAQTEKGRAAATPSSRTKRDVFALADRLLHWAALESDCDEAFEGEGEEEEEQEEEEEGSIDGIRGIRGSTAGDRAIGQKWREGSGGGGSTAGMERGLIPTTTTTRTHTLMEQSGRKHCRLEAQAAAPATATAPATNAMLVLPSISASQLGSASVRQSSMQGRRRRRRRRDPGEEEEAGGEGVPAAAVAAAESTRAADRASTNVDRHGDGASESNNSAGSEEEGEEKEEGFSEAGGSEDSHSMCEEEAAEAEDAEDEEGGAEEEEEDGLDGSIADIAEGWQDIEAIARALGEKEQATEWHAEPGDAAGAAASLWRSSLSQSPRPRIRGRRSYAIPCCCRNAATGVRAASLDLSPLPAAAFAAAPPTAMPAVAASSIDSSMDAVAAAAAAAAAILAARAAAGASGVTYTAGSSSSNPSMLLEGHEHAAEDSDSEEQDVFMEEEEAAAAAAFPSAVPGGFHNGAGAAGGGGSSGTGKKGKGRKKGKKRK